MDKTECRLALGKSIKYNCLMVLKERGNYLQKIAVAPCPGAWIEMYPTAIYGASSPVAPCPGARIEITIASLAFACIFEPPFPLCIPKSNYQLY